MISKKEINVKIEDITQAKANKIGKKGMADLSD